MASRNSLNELRDKVDVAIRAQRFDEALRLYEQLQGLEPEEPRWPHRKGDLLNRLGRRALAVDAFERAVDLYAKLGFIARAAAMAKVILGIDPTRTDVLDRVDPERARALHREQRTPLGRVPENVPSRSPSIEMEAVTLEPAADAGADEIRFTDTDIRKPPSLELDLSEAELSSRGGSVEGEEPSGEEIFELDLDDLLESSNKRDDRRPSPELLASLPSLPLFAEVPREALQEMLVATELIELSRGETLIETGTPADALYVVVEGNLRINVPGMEKGTPILVGEGDVVGESCLFEDQYRHADVVSVGRTRVLGVRKANLDELTARYPAVHDVLLELMTRRLLANVLRTNPIFTGFDPTTRTEVARLFEVRRARHGTVLLQQGKRSDGLYVVLQGYFDLHGVDGSLRAGPGWILGQRSLVAVEPSNIGAVAATEVIVLRLPLGRFNELAASYPMALMHLSDIAERSTLNAQRVGG